MIMDPVFASVVIAAIIAIVALVAINHRQEDVAGLAIKALGRLPEEKSSPEQTEKLQEESRS